MGRVLHWHNPDFILMVIDKINAKSGTLFKAKNDPPVEV